MPFVNIWKGAQDAYPYSKAGQVNLFWALYSGVANSALMRAAARRVCRYARRPRRCCAEFCCPYWWCPIVSPLRENTKWEKQNNSVAGLVRETVGLRRMRPRVSLTGGRELWLLQRLEVSYRQPTTKRTRMGWLGVVLRKSIASKQLQLRNNTPTLKLRTTNPCSTDWTLMGGCQWTLWLKFWINKRSNAQR